LANPVDLVFSDFSFGMVLPKDSCDIGKAGPTKLAKRVQTMTPVPFGSALAVQLLPAIARQCAIKVADPRPTLRTAQVAAGALRALRLPARVRSVEVTAYSREAWAARGRESAGRSASRGGLPGDPHCCVETGGALLDPCLDLLSVPGGSLTLRPSWFDLPPSWAGGGGATFSQQQTGAVVSYLPAPSRDDDIDDHGLDEPLLNRLVTEVVEICQKAQWTLAGAEPAPSRWCSLAG
jgi:hypothetical protein